LPACLPGLENFPMLGETNNQFSLALYIINEDTYKVWNEIETKRIQWKRNKTNPTKAKRNQREQNEIDWYEENGRKK
jgi:hypothetical protein